MMDMKEFNLQDIDLIPKPFSPGVLVSKVRNVLDRERAPKTVIWSVSVPLRYCFEKSFSAGQPISRCLQNLQA
jgi:DNA-binding response OmpR family regulator